MYVPPTFLLDDGALWAVVRDAGAGTLVVDGPHGLEGVFVPVVVSEDHRTVTAHVARANPWWRAVADGADVLAIFVAASAYVSPTFYPSRLEDPGVVPTWNYVSAHVRGRVRVHEDRSWLAHQVGVVTDQFELDRTPRWRVEDSDPAYVARLLGAIVGVEIDVTSIEGVAKLSQNRPPIDLDGVRQHLAEGGPFDQEVARRMKGRGRG